jgi:hypothetical protein
MDARASLSQCLAPLRFEYRIVQAVALALRWLRYPDSFTKSTRIKVLQASSCFK